MRKRTVQGGNQSLLQRFTYGPKGQPLSYATPLGYAYEWHYDMQGRLAGIARPSGTASTWTYVGDRGRLAQIDYSNATGKIQGQTTQFKRAHREVTTGYFFD